MVGDRDVFVAELLRRRNHGGDRVATVAPGAVHMQVATDVRVADEDRKLTALSRVDLTRALTKFGRNVGEPEMSIHDRFGNSLGAPADRVNQLALREPKAKASRAGRKLIVVPARSGVPEHRRAPLLGR